MDENRCYGCMRLKGDGPVCEHCGFDNSAQNAAHQLPMGTVLKGQYVVGKVLGQGGFGITYLGWDTFLKIPVAIKEYYPTGIVMRDSIHSLSVSNCEGNTGTQFSQNRDRFLREARSLAKLTNVPQVVHVLGFFPENDTAYIVMEYIQGKTLKSLVKDEGLLSPTRMMEIFLPILEGLAKVHEVGLIHRDISPDNIMLLPDGKVKLLDFGAVRDFGNDDNRSTQSILKHGYAPLEQYQRRGEMGPWTDIYALCGTIYYCMTGQVPPDAPERMMEDAEPQWEQIPGLTPGQVAALKKGTALIADNRVRSAVELKALLEKSDDPANQQTQTPPVAEAEPAQKASSAKAPVKKPKKKRRIRKLPILLTFVAAAAVLVLLYGSRPQQPETLAVPETVPETTAAVTEPVEETIPEPVEEPIYPCYVTYTDHGMVVTGDDLHIEITNDRDFRITAEGASMVMDSLLQPANAASAVSFKYSVVLLGANHSYQLYSTSYGNLSFQNSYSGGMSHQLMASIGPNAYPVNYDVEASFSRNGVMYIGRISEKSVMEPIVDIPFDYRELTQFEVSADVYTSDGTSSVNYHRIYEIVGEPPEETPAETEPAAARVDPYPKGNFKEKETYTVTSTADGTSLQGNNLHIFYSNDRELTITVEGIYVEDSYYVKPSGSKNRGTGWYGWEVYLKQGGNSLSNSLSIGTTYNTTGTGAAYWIKPAYMEHSLTWWVQRSGQTLHLSNVEFQPDSVTWRCLVPESIYDVPVEFDIEALTEIEVITYDFQKKMDLVRTYTAEKS